MWTSTEVLSASTSFPAPSRFPPASRARCGPGEAWHSTAPLGLGGSPTAAGRRKQPRLRGCGARGSSQGQHLCVIALLQGWAVPWGPGGLPVRGRQDAGHFWAPSPLHYWERRSTGALDGVSSSPQPSGLQPHLWVGNTSTVFGVCEASVTGAVLVAAAGTRQQQQGCWPTMGTAWPTPGTR